MNVNFPSPRNAEPACAGCRQVSPLSVALLVGAALFALVAPTVQSRTTPVTTPPPVHDVAATPDGMVGLDGGRFSMGFEDGEADERPVHEVELSPFFLDRTEVTNAAFRAFVDATHHLTRAERDGGCWAFLKGDTDFQFVRRADWRRPEGPSSSIDDRMQHPVVCVGWEDAAAFAAWAGKRLPTEAEWEFAARSAGGPHVRAFDGVGHASHDPSAMPVRPAHAGGAHQHDPTGESIVSANVWQGTWPATNTEEDGYLYTAPVGRFAPDGAGLQDMIGNVWEWTADWYAADYYDRSPRQNPRGPQTGSTRVARGGSWFCSRGYCGAYTSHFRGSSPPDQAFNNVGFRLAADVPAPSGSAR